MPIPTLITDLSQTAGSNYPAGSDSPSVLDDVQRAHAGFIAQLRDGKGQSTPLTLASATTTDIGGQNSQFVEISGSINITSLGTNYTGVRYLRFTGSLTLTHNSTSLNINGGASIVTVAGDTAIAIPNTALNGWNVYYFRGASAPDITTLGNVTVPTQTAGNSSGLIANTAFVTGAISTVSSKQIQNISAVASSNTMVVGLNPTTLDFRSTNLTIGSPNTRTLSSLTNITIPQGATLGAPSGNLTRISVGAIDNNGTIEPVVGGANINFDGSTLVNITAISNASNSSNVLYGTTSRSLVPLRYMGFLDSNQSSAGVYAAQPLIVQGAGGSAPQVGQWQYKRYPVVSTASGTSIDPFGGETINSQAKRITLNYVALSQASGDYFMFRLGTAGGLISTGYVGGVSTNGASVSNVSGFEIETRVDAAAKYSGKAVLELQDPVTNTWTISGASFNEVGDTYSFSGHLVLSGLLTQIRLTTPSAVTLDNGSISGMVEY
jgi:hypothetical protein